MLEAFLEQEPQYIALCISETWLTSEKLDTLNISRFQIASSYSRANRKGGGVCILLREDIEYKEEYAITEMSVEYIIEACACELPKEKILLIAIYWNRKEEAIIAGQLYTYNPNNKLNKLLTIK
ncbi:hypothetical protein ACJJTC_012393 [Scirpophaga incertulas]